MRFLKVVGKFLLCWLGMFLCSEVLNFILGFASRPNMTAATALSSFAYSLIFGLLWLRDKK